LFPGDKKGKPLSNMAMLELLAGMGYTEITVHGFRSTFQDWAEEYGEYPDVLVDKALAHQTKSKSRAAYQRGDMVERRRKMMEHWSQTPSTTPSVPARSAVTKCQWLTCGYWHTGFRLCVWWMPRPCRRLSAAIRTRHHCHC